jgi:hypothetical protein
MPFIHIFSASIQNIVQPAQVLNKLDPSSTLQKIVSLLNRVKEMLQKDIRLLKKQLSELKTTQNTNKSSSTYKADKYGDSLLGAATSSYQGGFGLSKLGYEGTSNYETTTSAVDPGANLRHEIEWREALLKKISDSTVKIQTWHANENTAEIRKYLNETSVFCDEIKGYYKIDKEDILDILNSYGGINVARDWKNFFYWKTLGVFTGVGFSCGAIGGFLSSGFPVALFVGLIVGACTLILVGVCCLVVSYYHMREYSKKLSRFNELSGVINDLGDINTDISSLLNNGLNYEEKAA